MPSEPTSGAAPDEGSAPHSLAFGGENSASLDAPSWRVAVASVTGPSHVRRGVGCEDAAAAASQGDWLVAVVCDGAGSSPRGSTGAAVAARSIAEDVLASVADSATLVGVREHLQSALAKARQKLAEIAIAEERSLSAFSTTVVGAIGCRDRVLFFQIGDGTAIGFGSADEIRAVSLGRPKEYANETYFLTDETWNESLLFEEADGVDSIFLVTDGVSPFLLEADVPKASFYQPVLEFLRRQGAGKGASAVQRLLSRDVVRKVVADDKTLLWAQWLGTKVEEPVVSRESAELAG